MPPKPSPHAPRPARRAARGGALAGHLSRLPPRLILSRPDLGIEPVRRTMQRTGPGRFHHDGPEFAVPGRWVVRVEVLVGDFDLYAFETTIPVP